MKRLLLGLMACVLSAAAHAQATDITVSIVYTPGVASQLSLINSTITAINNTYSSQGINVRVLAPTLTPGGLPDSSSMLAQFVWAQKNVNALQAAAFMGASMSIVVSAPGTGVPGIIPAAPPTNSFDAAAAVNIADLQTQLQDAISRIIGAGNGVAIRQRTYNPLVNECFHTRESAPSDVNASIPYPAGYQVRYPNPASMAGSQQASCDTYRQLEGGGLTYYSAEVISNYCYVFSSTHTLTSGPDPITYVASQPGGTITCTEVRLDQYSKNGATYHGYPIGDATHDSVGDMNARKNTPVGLWGDSFMNRYKAAKAGILQMIRSALDL